MLRDDPGAIRWVLTPNLLENPDHLPIKQTVQTGDAFEDNAFKPGFEIVKF
jgi:hypothetical protein